jgi:hypothetical protein
VTAAARLLERNVQVRVAAKPFRFDDHDFARGSVLVTRLDNRVVPGDVRQAIDATARELGLQAVAIGSGLGEGDLPDLGGEHFQRLEPPRIALLTRAGLNTYDTGEIWFLLDHTVGIRHSQLDASTEPDISRYNVIIVPDRFGGVLSGTWTNRLKDWVKAGGTLIAMNSSAAQFAQEKSGLSKVRTLPEVLGKLGDYELAVFREWLGRTGEMPTADIVWSHQTRPGLKYPWQAIGGDHPEEKELKKRDAWQKLFMPQGALVASRVDTNHWLTLGCGEMLPVLVFNDAVLMAAEGVETPIRLGYLTKTQSKGEPDRQAGAADEPDTQLKANAPASRKDAGQEEKESEKRSEKEKKEPPRIGWCALPPDTEMHLRMSGLLWPEAAYRLANSAYVTREAYGRGQIILFAAGPTFRVATLGPIRVMLNAMIYGPGFGAAQPVRP